MPIFRAAAVTDPIAVELLDEYFTSREAGFTTHPDGYRVVRPDPEAFTPPRGVFLVAEDAAGPVGCGGVRVLDAERAEIKHLWMRERARGRGWGRELLGELEARAAGLGARLVVLDTNETLVAAQNLYRTSGYVQIEPYNDNRNATHWFAKPLAGSDPIRSRDVPAGDGPVR